MAREQLREVIDETPETLNGGRGDGYLSTREVILGLCRVPQSLVGPSDPQWEEVEAWHETHGKELPRDEEDNLVPLLWDQGPAPVQRISRSLALTRFDVDAALERLSETSDGRELPPEEAKEEELRLREGRNTGDR